MNTSKYVQIGWQARFIDPEEGPSIWTLCDNATAEILKDDSRYELRAVYVKVEEGEHNVPASA